MMNKMMKLMLIAVFSITVLCAGGMKKVEALSIIIIDDPTTAGFDVIVADETAAGVLVAVPGGTAFTTHAETGIWAGTPNILTFGGAVGSFLVSTTGSSSHLSILGGNGLIHQGGLAISGGAGVLDFWYSDNDFTVPALVHGVVDYIGGTTAGTVTAFGWIDSSNIEFDDGFAVPPIGPLGPLAFSGGSSLTLNPILAAPFSLTKKVTVVHTAFGGTTSFNNELVATPEPGTIALLGIGLAGLVGVGVRRKMKTRKQAG